MNLDKIFEYKDKLQEELSFEEINKLYREILYNEYEKFGINDSDEIQCYQLLKALSNIFGQMINGRKFDKNYLKDEIRWK